MTNEGIVVWYNPRCSTCQSVDELLAHYGVAAHRIRYLDDPPGRDEILRVFALLGATDPRAMMRTSEQLYGDLGLQDASADTLIDAMASHPELIERPIVIRDDRAVVARPPELLLTLLDGAGGGG